MNADLAIHLFAAFVGGIALTVLAYSLPRLVRRYFETKAELRITPEKWAEGQEPAPGFNHSCGDK